MTKEAYIPQYKGDEPNDQGDLDTRFGNQEKHKRGGVKFNSKRSVDNIILEKHNKVKAGHKLTSGEVDTILDYAGDDRREAAFSVLRDHYNLYENIDNLTHRDILNIVAIRNYAEKENKEQWVNEFDEKLNKYFVGIDIPKDTVRELRENIFNERIHYEAVREGFENFEDKVSDHKAWQNIEDIDEKIDQEKRLYIYLSHPSISPSLSGYSTQDAPLIADGGLGEKFTGGFTGLISEAVEYGIERSSAATTEDLDNVEERLSSDIDHTNDLIDRNSREINEIRSDLKSIINGRIDDLASDMVTEEDIGKIVENIMNDIVTREDLENKIDRIEDSIDDMEDNILSKIDK